MFSTFLILKIFYYSSVKKRVKTYFKFTIKRTLYRFIYQPKIRSLKSRLNLCVAFVKVLYLFLGRIALIRVGKFQTSVSFKQNCESKAQH